MSRTSEEERREEKCKKKTKNFFNFFRPLLFFCFPREAKKKKSFSISRKQALSKNLSFSPLLSLSTKKQQKNKRQFLVLGGWFSLSLSPLLFFFFKGFEWQKGKFSFCSFRPSFWSFSPFFPPPRRERERERGTARKKRDRRRTKDEESVVSPSRATLGTRERKKKLQPRLFFSSLLLFFSRSLSSFIHPLSLNACSQVPAL